MRPVNLTPVENRHGEAKPLRAGAFSYIVLGALALALAGIVGVVLTGNQVTDSKNDLVDLKSRQKAAEQRVQEFAAYGNFATMSEQRRQTVADLAQSRFDWERVLDELARVLPDDIWLDGLTASVAPGADAGAGAGTTSTTSISDPSITGPSLIITGCGDGQDAVARFVTTLKDIDGVTRVGLQQSKLGEQVAAGTSTAATGAAPTGTASTGGCQTREFIAAFSITVAFDAVPTAAAAAPAAPDAAVAPVATTDDGGVASAETAQQTATDSAAEQTQSAESGASAVGMGG